MISDHGSRGSPAKRLLGHDVIACPYCSEMLILPSLPWRYVSNDKYVDKAYRIYAVFIAPCPHCEELIKMRKYLRTELQVPSIEEVN